MNPRGTRQGHSRRESGADRREWERMRAHLRVKTFWGVPLRLFLAAIMLGLALPWVDRAFALVFRPYPDLNSESVASILGIIAGAMMTLSGLVFAALSAAMSFGVTSLSVRIVPVFQEDTVLRWGMGMFVGTFVYALLIALSIATGEDNYKPWAATVGAVLATVGCGVMFIAIVVRVCQHLNPAVLLRRLAADGYRGMQVASPSFHADAATVASRHLPDGHAVRRSVTGKHGDALLAVNTPRLLDFETEWDMRIELVPKLGSPVPYDGVVFRTSAPTTPDQDGRLLDAVAFGDVYSPANGPFGALRSMVDIALKALSPAVNDPTRAVQALDQIEDILIRLAPRVAAEQERLADHPGASVLRSWSRSWDDYIAAATDEIRQFGWRSVQIQRRLRALYAELIEQCPPEQHPPLEERIAALGRGVDQWWNDPLDRRLSRGTDPQGLGTVHDDAATPGS
ncbi:DUF2254 family protein [Streptomyces exfoliatus]|uniref:DUF2254 family protein n=1 Tax=Streptomyces exfoliatus TaxID=1905 RepID=A0ABV3D6L4_STREX